MPTKKNSPEPKPWYLYVLNCKGNKLYTGITVNLEQRFKQHQLGKGAAFTRINPPLELLAAKTYPCRSSATKAEIAFKKLTKQKKLTELQSWEIQLSNNIEKL